MLRVPRFEFQKNKFPPRWVPGTILRAPQVVAGRGHGRGHGPPAQS
jgi:hypothetical protein